MLNELCPFVLRRQRHARISIAGQIDEVEFAVDPVKIDRLRSARRITGERQPLLSRNCIDQTGFADIASPQKSDLGQPIGGELLGTVGA